MTAYKSINKTKAVLSALLLFCMITSLLCGCSAKEIRNFSLSEEIISSEKDLSLSSTKTAPTKSNRIISSGMTGLYIDRKTASPIIKNQSAVWRALPKTVNKSSEETPAVFTLEVISEGQRYVLNSQSDGVKKQSPVSTKTDNGVCTEYILFLELENKTVEISVPVNYYLEDGSFFVSVDCSAIASSDKNFVVTKISLLDYFGSDTGSDEGDYILVPDNCGAIIDTYKAKKSFKNVSFKVYGDAEKNNAFIGAYGMKKESSAFVAMIEKGDTIATVNAQVAARSGYNRVGAEFEITQTMTKTVKDAQRIYVAGESYNGEIRICYRFTQGNNANYSGMAIACREHLIRTGVLSADTVDDTDELPFILSTVGDAGTVSGRPNTNLTNFEQLLDMLTYLKGKGFSNIFVRYKGALTGGLNQSAITKCDLLKTLGTQEQFKELTDYVSAQQMKLFFDMSITSCAFSSVGSSSLARDLTGAPYSVDRTNMFGTSSKVGFTAYDKIADNVISIFSLTKKSGISNMSINDASAFLYSDCENGATRDEVAQMLKQECASLTTIGELMVEKGNFYMLKNVSVISSLPIKVSYKESSVYKAVPFIPLILHATTEYGSESINLSGDYKKSMLRCVEYGALPQFEWCYEDIETTVEENETQQSTDPDSVDEAADESAEKASQTETGETAEAQTQEEMKPYSYSDWATAAYAFYEKANRALGDIRDSRMTAHYEVQSGVFCTEYGDTSVYVNYTDEDVTIGGVTVAANDFMRVN